MSMHRRIRGSGRRNGLRANPANREVPAKPEHRGRKATKRPIHRNGNIPPVFQ